MAIQAMALGVNNPEINAVSALAAGQQARQSFDMNNIAIAQKGLETIGSVALGAMGGNIDGKADPALFNEGLDFLAQQGVPVDMFRDRADLAPVIARSSMTALQQIQTAQDERSYQLALDNFELEVMKAAQGPAPTTEMRNFDWAAGDPDKLTFLGKGPDGKPPTIVETFDPATGQPIKGYMDGLTFVPVGGPKAPSNGLTVTTNPDGTTTVQQGGAPKPFTEGQSKDTVYVTRAKGALPALDEFGSSLMNPVERAVEGDPTGIARGMQSPEFQQAQQAGKEFLQAILRKDTGAAITPQETAEYGTVYLPVPGDGPEVLERKRVSRQRAVEAIEAGLPPQAILASEQALINSSPAATAPQTAPPSAPAGEPARPMSQADYDAIPSGGLFVDPDDGQTYRKP